MVCLRNTSVDTLLKGDTNNNNNNNNNNNKAKKILKYEDLTIEIHVECKNKGDSSNNRRVWDHFKVI
jgi:hypothetical protein